MAFGILNLPNLGVAPSILAELGTEWPIDIAFSYWLENTEALADRTLDLRLHPLQFVPYPASGSRMSFSALQVNAATCPLRHPLDAGAVLVCGGVYAALLSAESEGLVDTKDATRPLFGLEAYARWHFNIAGPVGLSYSAGLFVPFVREGFGYLDRDGQFRELFRAPVVGGRVDVVLTFAFE